MKDLLKKVFSNTTSNKRRILQQKLKSKSVFYFSESRTEKTESK